MVEQARAYRVGFAKGKGKPMMGSKQRDFAPLLKVSLEDLVPSDHFYRHLEQRSPTFPLLRLISLVTYW
jgi:hypothetical protein